MKLIFSLCLAIFLLGGAIGDSYSKSYVPSVNQLLQYRNLAITEHLDNFDRYHFEQDEHIEEAEFVFEDDIIKKNILSKNACGA